MSQQLSGISPQMPSVSSQVPGVQLMSEIQPQMAGVSSQMQNGLLQIPNSGPSRSPTGSPMPPSGLSQEPAKVSADVYFASNGDTAAQQSKMLHAAASLVKQESSNPPDEANDWARCCKCHQWRIMRYSDNWKDNPKWECAMNEDPKYHRCNVPQEVVTKTQKKEVEEWRPEEDVESSAGEDDDENDEDFQVGDEDGITRKRGRRGSGRINKPTAAAGNHVRTAAAGNHVMTSAAGNHPSTQIGDPYSQIFNPQGAQANHPNMHQQQFIAQQQQYLAKLAQQQQMEIMQQGRQQLLQQGGQQFMQSVGQQFMQSGGQQFMQSGIQQLMQPGGHQFMQPGGQQFMQPGGQQFMQSAAQRMQPGGQQFILPPSQNFMQPTSQGPAANNEFMKSNEEWTQEETKAALQFVSKHGFSNAHLLKTHPILRLRHTSMAEVQSRVSHLYSRARSKGIAAAQPTTHRRRPPPNRKPSASDELFLNSSRGVRAARRREQRFVPTRRRLSDFLSDSEEEEEEEAKTGESSDSEDDWEANPRRARRPVEASRRSSRRLGTTPVKSYCEDSGDERFLGGDRYVPEKPKHSIDKLLATRLARMRVDAGAQSDSDDDGLYDWRAMARKQQQSGVNEKAGKTESANAISEPQTPNLSSAKNLVKSQTFGPNSPAAADQESIDGEDLRFRPGWHPEKVFKDPREMTRAPEERWAEVRQFLTKIKGEPYSRCLWFTEEQLSRRFGGASTRSRVQNFMKKRHEIEARNEELWGVGVNFEPDFLRIDRVVSSQTISRVDKETNMSVPVEMFLVVWGGGSSYSNATWETAAEINSPEKINEYRRHNTAPSPPTTPKNPKFLVKEENKFKNGNTLRDYQLAGVNWLVSKFLEDRNCILADEMGLGKTVQTISFLQFLYFRMHIRGPFLIVAPLSTIRHWKREIEEWTELNVVLYYDPIKGKETRGMIRKFEFYYESPGTFRQKRVKFDILLTTYEIVMADIEELKLVQWEYLVVDEGHRLKNKATKVSLALSQMMINRRLLLSGTPIQNNVEELWTLLNFLEPQIFQSYGMFAERYGDLKSSDQVRRLQSELTPYILRRLKENVEKAIPPKQETIIDIELTTLQKQYYRAIYERNRDFLTKGCDKGNLPQLMNIEIQLRKCCNHPFMIAGVEDKEVPESCTWNEYFRITIASSGKLVFLDKLMHRLKEEGHKVLIFSQMQKVLDILAGYMKWKHFKFERIDGCVTGTDRQTAIDRFNHPDSDHLAFLLTTRAGGVGLNLTAADTVILYDSDWNPQQDLQAQARCHRIGQQNPVMVYRLVTKNTYESEMFKRASMKLGLDRAILSQIDKENDMSNVPEKDKKDLDRMLRHGAYALVNEDESASKKFCETDLDELLKTNAHVVEHESKPSGGFGGITFTKMNFESADADSSIDVNAKDFWDKVLVKNKQHFQSKDEANKLLVKLQDSAEDMTTRQKNDFFKDMKTLIQSRISEKQAGKEFDMEPTVALLTVFQTAEKFSEAHREQAKKWINTLEKRVRRQTVRAPIISSFRSTARAQATRTLTQKRARMHAHDDEAYSGDDAGDESEYDGRMEDDELDAEDIRMAKKRSLADRSSGHTELCVTCLRGGKLLLCDGPCQGSYHMKCEGLQEMPKSSVWKCENCKKRTHKCFLCREVADKTKKGMAFTKCQSKTCGRVYHVQCSAKIRKEDPFYKKHKKFLCPLHHCSKCHKANELPLIVCMLCPTAFHTRCTPLRYVRLTEFQGVCPPCVKRRAEDVVVQKALNSRHTFDRMELSPAEIMDLTDDKSFRFRPKWYRVRWALNSKPTGEPVHAQLFFPDLSEEEESSDDEPEKKKKDDGLPCSVDECRKELGSDYVEGTNWCRQCGAKDAPSYKKGPWGPKMLCPLHSFEWSRNRKMFENHKTEPKTSIDPESSTDLKYLKLLVQKKRKGLPLYKSVSSKKQKVSDSGSKKSSDKLEKSTSSKKTSDKPKRSRSPGSKNSATRTKKKKKKKSSSKPARKRLKST
eukprot:913444_1